MNCPEVKSLLDVNSVAYDRSGIFTNHDGMALGKNFSMNVSNITVSSILNQAIRESDTRFWFINRDGERRKYLVLRL